MSLPFVIIYFLPSSESARSSRVKLTAFGAVQVGTNAIVSGTIPQVSAADSSRARSFGDGMAKLAGGTGKTKISEFGGKNNAQ